MQTHICTHAVRKGEREREGAIERETARERERERERQREREKERERHIHTRDERVPNAITTLFLQE